MSGYFPITDAEVLSWHSNFKAECAKHMSVLDGALTPEFMKQIEINQATIEFAIQGTNEAIQHARHIHSWKEQILRGPSVDPVPEAPASPATPHAPPNSLTGIENITEHIAKHIRAHANYTESMGQALGIISVGPDANTPSLTADPLSQSQVELVISMAKFTLIALDRRVNGGDWKQIDTSSIKSYLDTDWPLVNGKAEQREYRVQGMIDGNRVGALSEVVSVMTSP